MVMLDRGPHRICLIGAQAPENLMALADGLKETIDYFRRTLDFTEAPIVVPMHAAPWLPASAAVVSAGPLVTTALLRT